MRTALPDEVAALAEKVAAAAGPLQIVGGGSRAGFGEPVAGAEPLATKALSAVVAHEPSELYVTAQAGANLAELAAVLREAGQELAGDPPRPERGTLGGACACGISGPGRPAAGRLRDHVLGCQVIDGQGRALRFGGTLIKNVAGYDVTRLMVGALGTLGVITELTLRLRGMPQATATLVQECSKSDALQRANEAVARGAPVAASAWVQGVLRLRLEGSEAAVNRAMHELGGAEDRDADAGFWSALRDGRNPLFAQARQIWMCQVPAMSELPFDDHGLIEWHGARRWFFDDAPAGIRAAVAAVGGAAVLYRAPPGEDAPPVFPAPAEPVLAIHRRLKEVFDPRGILNPGRLGFL